MRKGSLTVATISGVPVRVHWTFLLLLLWVFGTGVSKSGSFAQGAAALAFITSVFACVVAHEFGHILAARYFGVRTRDVTLLPIGGVATLERIPESPWQELIVAVAGPLVNIVIAAALLVGLFWRGRFASLISLGPPSGVVGDFVASLAGINLWLVAFNMIPAFPMDGGRVLRAALALLMARSTATRIAATVGRVLAVGMALIGIFAGMPMLFILAIFVFVGAGAEAAAANR